MNLCAYVLKSVCDVAALMLCIVCAEGKSCFSDSLSKIQRVFFSSLSLVASRESLGDEIHCSICGVTVKKAFFFLPTRDRSVLNRS